MKIDVNLYMKILDSLLPLPYFVLDVDFPGLETFQNLRIKVLVIGDDEDNNFDTCE